MEKITHRADSAAFRTEYLKSVPDQAIRDELRSYLAEYRFQLPQYKYDLIYFDDHLRDTYTNETMVEKAERSITLRRSNWKNVLRESAEYRGIQYLDSVLRDATLGDRIIWASPPGSKQEGYGNYGFVFSGVIDDISNNKKHISMTAFRVEESSVASYNKAVSTIFGQPILHDTPEEFLAQPFISHTIQVEPEIALNNMLASKKIDDKQFELAMGVIEPLMNQFIVESKSGASKDRLKQLFYTIEHLAIKLNKSTDFTELYSLSNSLHQNFEGIVQKHGMFKPFIVGGSCGSSGEESTLDNLLNRNIMNKLTNNILATILDENEGFECPRCHYKTKEPVGNQCPNANCKLTKEEAERLGYITC